MWYASRTYRLERRAARAFGLKDYAGAIRALDDLLHVVGENPNTLHVLATCRQRLGDHESAIAAAERGISADPKHLACLKVLAECHAAREDLRTARGYALRALALIEAGTRAEEKEWESWAHALCEYAEDAVK